MKKGYVEKFWKGVHLEEEEEKEDLEIRGCRKLTTGMREKGIDNMKWMDKEEWRRKIKL